MRNLKEIIPAAIVLVFLGSFAALVMELLISGVTGKSVPPEITSALSAIVVACLPLLVTLYLRDSSARPPSPPPDRPRGGLEPTGDEESDAWNRERGWLEMRVGRCSLT